MTHISAVHPVLAPYRYTQPELTDAVARMCGLDGGSRRVLERLHTNARVKTRHLALPLERYASLSGLGATNDAYISCAMELSETAVRGALEAADVRPDSVDVIVTTTVTGMAVPSLDARFAARIGLRDDVKRLPLFGLGCVGGAAAIARAHDMVRGSGIAVVLAVELCSLTWQRADVAVPNLVASALFGDGAAAVVLGGTDGPIIVDTRSVLYPATERVMGWDIGDNGFGVVLGSDVPDVVRDHLGADVKAFLATHGLTIDDISTWVCHPGGPKVLEAVESALTLAPDALTLTWQSLARIGNLSSASVLHVLHDTLEERPSPSGSFGLLLAMGPGFCSELVLLRF